MARAGKNDMLASEERKLDKLVREFLLQAGAVEVRVGEFEVETNLGKLRVNPSGHNIFCRFEDEERAKARGIPIDNLHVDLFGVYLNSYSGKWNHHYFGRATADYAFRDFARKFRGLL